MSGSAPDGGFGVPVSFRVVWRGYDRHQVDRHIRRLQQAESGTATSETGAPGEGLLSAQFDVVLRGYDRREVDAFLARFSK